MQYTPNFSLEMPDASDPFGDFRQSYNDNLVIIDNNLGGGGGSGDTVSWTQIQQSGTKIAEIDINGTSQDVYAPSGGGGGGAVYMGAELLWEGSFSGAGTIDVPNLDQYLVIAVQNDVSVLVIGNAFTGSGALGLYNQASFNEFAYRFNTAVANKLTVDANNRGIIRSDGSNTYFGGTWCTITKIYGLVKKTGADGRGGTTYTTTEQVVGTWLGKPLYQQSIPFSGLNFTGNVDYPFDVSSYAVNADKIFFLHDMSFYIVSNVQRSFIYSTSSPVQGTNIQLRTEVNRSNASGYLTIRYTKTTD